MDYDKYGRMLYDPEFHENQGKRWAAEEVQYLKDYYAFIGPEEMSYALGRTDKSIMTKACKLGIHIENFRREK